jgi:hypothetical protein
MGFKILNKNIKLNNGYIIENPYTKINSIVLRGNNADFNIAVFKDYDCRLSNYEPMKDIPEKYFKESYSVNINIEKAIHFQLYDYLKKLPEFANTIDC